MFEHVLMVNSVESEYGNNGGRASDAACTACRSRVRRRKTYEGKFGKLGTVEAA